MEDPRFKKGINKYLECIQKNCYMFEVSKCCGYSEIVPAFKNATCGDLYRNIMCQFEIKQENKIRVFARDASNNTMVIQNDKTPIRNIILENAIFFKPIYPIPTSVVYKIAYEIEEINCVCCSCNSQK